MDNTCDLCLRFCLACWWRFTCSVRANFPPNKTIRFSKTGRKPRRTHAALCSQRQSLCLPAGTCWRSQPHTSSIKTSLTSQVVLAPFSCRLRPITHLSWDNFVRLSTKLSGGSRARSLLQGNQRRPTLVTAKRILPLSSPWLHCFYWSCCSHISWSQSLLLPIIGLLNSCIQICACLHPDPYLSSQTPAGSGRWLPILVLELNIYTFGSIVSLDVFFSTSPLWHVAVLARRPRFCE